MIRFLGAALAAGVLLGAVTGCDRGDDGGGSTQSGGTRISRMDNRAQPTKKPKRGDKASAGNGSEKAGNGADVKKPAQDDASGEARVIIHGKVTLPDGSPASDARISIGSPRFGFLDLGNTDTSQIVTHTAKDGTYELSTTNPMAMNLKVAKDGYANIAQIVQSDAIRYGEKLTKTVRVRNDFKLMPDAAVAGSIRDEAGKPVSGVRISLMSSELLGGRGMGTKPYVDVASTTSSAEGTFRLAGVTPGSYEMTVDPDDHVPQTLTVAAPSDGTNVTLVSAGALIEGTVVMLGTGEAISSASVGLTMMPGKQQQRMPMLRPRKAVTKTDGTFRFAHLPEGQFMLSAEKDRLRTMMDTQNPSFKLEPRETTSGIVMELYAGHTVAGVVKDKETGNPVEGVEVSSPYGNRMYQMMMRAQGQPAPDTSGNQSITDAEGRYKLTNQFGAQLQLNVEKKGYRVARKDRYSWQMPSVQLKRDSLEVTKDIELDKLLLVSGYVKLENGKPVGGAEVSSFSNDYSGQNKKQSTDKDGLYEVEAERFKQLSIKAKVGGLAPGYTDLLQVEDVPLTAPDIILKPGGEIHGTVVTPDDTAADLAGVAAYVVVPMGGGSSRHDSLEGATADGAGNFSMHHLPERTVNVSANKKGFSRSLTEKIDIGSGESRPGVKLKLRTAFSISGKVTDEKGKALQGANVSCYSQTADSASANAQTDAEGKYKLEDLNEVVYDLNANHSGYQYVQKPGIRAGSENVDIVMKETSSPSKKEPSGSASFIGKVVDWSTKAGLTNYTAELVSGGEGTTVMKDPEVAGRFTVLGLRTNYGFKVKIQAPGYMDYESSTFAGQAKPQEVLIEMGPGGTISGRTVANGKPVKDVKVLLLGVGESYELRERPPLKIVTTGIDGTFSFEQVAAGKNNLSIRPPQPYVMSRTTVDVKQGVAADAGDIELTGGGRIHGTVVRMPGDKPAENVSVEASNYELSINKTARTDAKGEFLIENLSAGSYSMTLREHNLYASAEVKGAETAEVTFKIGSGVLNGRVLKRGAPSPGTQVSLRMEKSSVSATADANGEFQIKGLAPGKYTASLMVRVQMDDSSSYYHTSLQQEEQVEIGTGETEKTFTIPSGQIRATVVDSAGQPKEKVNVKITAPTGRTVQRSTMVSKPDGTVSFDNLAAGEYQLTARDSSGYASAKATLGADSDANVTLKLEKGSGGTLVSTALNMEGQPVREAWCKLSGPGGNFEHGVTRDASGVMTITDIPPGTYNVEVSYWSHSISNRSVEIKTGETVRIDDVLYPAGALTWTVQDQSGSPVANASCTLTPADPNSIEKVRTGSTGSNGQCIMRGMAAGAYNASAKLPDGRTVTGTVQVAAGAMATLTTKPYADE